MKVSDKGSDQGGAMIFYSAGFSEVTSSSDLASGKAQGYADSPAGESSRNSTAIFGTDMITPRH